LSLLFSIYSFARGVPMGIKIVNLLALIDL
jgi:hypothetical protein